MRKRIRKKLKLKEFTELGFRVLLKFDNTRPTSKSLIADFLTFTIDKQHLSCGGCTDDNQLEMFITTVSGASANEKHRQLIEKWVKKRSEITSVSIGPLEKARQ